MAGSVLLTLNALQLGCEPQSTATLDDSLRAYEGKRYAESLRIAQTVQKQSNDLATRQQAAYLVGCSANELAKRDEAREAFALAARSNDPEVAGRALAMQAALAVEDKRWADAASTYTAAASKLTGSAAAQAREQANDALLKSRESTARVAAQPPTVGTDSGSKGAGSAPPTAPAVPLPATNPQAPWTIAAGAFGSETAARQRATNLAKEAKRAGLPTPRVLAVSSPDQRVWIVEIGSFATRESADLARKKFTTTDAAVVRSRVPVPRG